MKSKFADTLLINGRFITLENENEIAEAVAIESGKILFVGSAAEALKLVDEHTEIIDLHGKVAAPGLIESHTHPLTSGAERFSRLNLSGENTTSLKKMLDCIRDAAANTPKGEWIIAAGYDESKFEEGSTEINAKVLDAVTCDHPVFITRTCGHIAVINSKAMEISGLSDQTEDPESSGHFFRDSDGHLTGMLSGPLAMRMIPYPPVTMQQRKNGLVTGVQREYFKHGVTSTTSMGVRPDGIRNAQEANREKNLKLKIGFFVLGNFSSSDEPMSQKVIDIGLLPGFGDDTLRFLGVKFTTDGSTGGRTAAFSVPYADDPNNYGELYYDQDVLNENILRTAQAGVQVSIHAIGDRAIESALQSIEYANANGVDTSDLRFRIEHLESPTPEQIERIKKLNILVSLSSVFIYSLGDSHVSALGYDRLVDAFPAKTLMDKGILVACNSDCPICPVNPMIGIYAMVNRMTEKGQSFGGKKESVDRIRALEAYTKNAAYMLWQEDKIGTLKKGKLADIVVFEQDFLNVPDEELKDIEISMTFANGEMVYKKA